MPQQTTRRGRVSVSVMVREYVYQNPGATPEQIADALNYPELSVRRRLLEHSNNGALNKDGWNYYPPATPCSDYYLDKTLTTLLDQPRKIIDIAREVPMAPGLMARSVRALASYGIVEMRRGKVSLTEAGRARLLSAPRRPSQVSLTWAPTEIPRSLVTG